MACEKEYDIYPGDTSPDENNENDEAEPTSSDSPLNIFDYFSSASVYVKDFAFDSHGILINYQVLRHGSWHNHMLFPMP